MLLAIALLAGVRLLQQGKVAGDILASTTCPFFGPAVVTLRGGIDAADTLPLRVHEEVHVAQCGELGPLRYRLRNLTGEGKLSLEVPAYCAAAKARIRTGWTRKAARERLQDDLNAALAAEIDLESILEASRSGCSLDGAL